MTSRYPTSTYRLQITAEFDLFAAARALPYLHELGADWVYLSPILQAEPGSTHGYDVIAHDRVDASRGGAEGLAAVSAEAKRLGMGVLVDIVPNHMGVATPPLNQWWWELLREGPTGARAAYFDVDWAAGGGKILVPVVGDDELLPDGTIGHLSVGDGELRYHDNRYPIADGTGDGDPDEVHARQHYELVGWRRADAELNYRRFFSINTLAAVRVEERPVFEESHAEIRRWFDEGLVDGLRVDHPDGLRDPGGYLDDLATMTGGAYVLVEKILEPGEELQQAWATQGTTGYDALGWIDRVLTDPAGEAPLSELAASLGGPEDWRGLVHDRKRQVADHALQAEVRRIARDLGPSPDVFNSAVDAIAEVLAWFPVYRSYLPDGLDWLQEAVDRARESRPDLAATYDALWPRLSDAEDPAALRFQQTSGMVMAKGVEDNAFYRWSMLTSLAEVGGDPAVFAETAADFHAWATHRQQHWPQAMTALTTHDTKRGEDTRARITVLAEVPGDWADAVRRLGELAPVPDPAFGNLLWQAVVGVWGSSPDEELRGRLHGYAEKAMREAGAHTTWTDPAHDFEAAVHRAVNAALDDPSVRSVLSSVSDLVAGPGEVNALAAKLLALTLPGVPDVYQGSEIIERSLVDPDNRRPVDFARASAALRAGSSTKQRLTAAALRLRRDRPSLFGDYRALVASGPAADHALAFDRGGAITVVTRLPVGLDAVGGWGSTTLALPEGSWVDVLTGRPAPPEGSLAELMAEHPVALLVEES